MSEQNPSGTSGQKPEPAIDLSKVREAVDRTAGETANTVNQTFNTELKSSHVRSTAGFVGGLVLTAGVAYLAGKKGVKAGMKDYIHTGQSLVDAAGNYADIAQQNALITAENAAKSHEVLMLVGEVSNKLEKAISKATKK